MVDNISNVKWIKAAGIDGTGKNMPPWVKYLVMAETRKQQVQEFLCWQ